MTEGSESSRYVPVNELDFASMTTEPAWKDFSDELNQSIIRADDGSLMIDYTVFYRMLSFYTRDLRLANLALWNGEYNYCRKWLNLASDLLRFNVLVRAGKVRPFFIAISRVISVVELSQSKGGFFRRRPNTLTNESVGVSSLEPDKKNPFQQKKSNNVDGGRYV